MNLKTSNNWFANDAQIKFDKYLTADKIEVRNYLEIGVCEGCSMHWVLTHHDVDGAVGIDYYKGGRRKDQSAFDVYKANMLENLKPWIEDGTLVMFYEHSRTALSYLTNRRGKPFDLIYVDGGHSAYECMFDMVMSYELLVPKTGLIVVDDLNRHCGPKSEYQVWPAVHAYELIMHTRMKKIWEDGRQCCFRRLG